MDQALKDAYRMVMKDLKSRSQEAQAREKVNRRYVISVENARAVLARESRIEWIDD